MCSFGRVCLLLLALCGASVAQDGYEAFPTVPGSTYKLYYVHVSWSQALAFCQGDGDGSHLVIINSQAEADLVKQLFARITDYSIWFVWAGASDINQEGTWVTVLGGLVSNSGYNVWAPGEPNNAHPNEDCADLDREARYNDDVCSYDLPFICEKPVV